MPYSETNPPEDPLLRFPCGGCGHELEAPVAYAGVEGPCPLCGEAVRAPLAPQPKPRAPGRLHLPPLDETGLVDLGPDFWEQGKPSDPPMEPQPLPAAPASVETCQISAPVLPGPLSLLGALASGTPPRPVEGSRLPEPADDFRKGEFFKPEETETLQGEGYRKRQFRLRFFDAALIALFLGILAMGGAALAFTQAKKGITPPPAPELSRLVVERMEQLDRQRDQAVESARTTVRQLVTATEPAAMDGLCLPGDPVLKVPCFAGPGGAPADFEFIQARRIPGTDRFLTLFELLADPPVVVPVEETPAGSRLHGMALAQQQGGTLGKFLASQGQGEAVFYVSLRPGPAPMAEELIRTRPDLRGFRMVSVEPAFPADGSSGCLACLAPDSSAAAIFAKRAHDPGLRPAVVRLAWRQHRESGNYIELVSFEPNAWSRH